jgi:hypothetical protein
MPLICRLPWIARGILAGLLALAVGQIGMYLYFIWYTRYRRNSSGIWSWDPLEMFTIWSYPPTWAQVIKFLYIVIVFRIGFVLGVRCLFTSRR